MNHPVVIILCILYLLNPLIKVWLSCHQNKIFQSTSFLDIHQCYSRFHYFPIEQNVFKYRYACKANSSATFFILLVTRFFQYVWIEIQSTNSSYFDGNFINYILFIIQLGTCINSKIVNKLFVSYVYIQTNVYQAVHYIAVPILELKYKNV